MGLKIIQGVYDFARALFRANEVQSFTFTGAYSDVEITKD